jgi:hypothetical protein
MFVEQPKTNRLVMPVLTRVAVFHTLERVAEAVLGMIAQFEQEIMRW